MKFSKWLKKYIWEVREIGRIHNKKMALQHIRELGWEHLLTEKECAKIDALDLEVYL